MYNDSTFSLNEIKTINNKIKEDLLLASSPIGRIEFHIRTMIKDHHYIWHIKGIIRDYDKLLDILIVINKILKKNKDKKKEKQKWLKLKI